MDGAGAQGTVAGKSLCRAAPVIFQADVEDEDVAGAESGSVVRKIAVKAPKDFPSALHALRDRVVRE